MKSAILKGGTLLALGPLFAWSIGAATGYVLGVVTFALTLGLILISIDGIAGRLIFYLANMVGNVIT